MWYKSHHWVNKPYTKYERKCVMNVRENIHTVMIFDRKYFDVDTLKFDSNRIKTMSHLAIADIIDDNEFGYGKHYKPPHTHNDNYYINNEGRQVTIPRYIPRDDFK
jgi:hypothetical protein